LLRELKQSIGAFEARYGARWKGMALTGVSSAHPLIAELLQQELSLPVRVIRPQAATGVGGVRHKQLMVQQSLTRLMGLGLRLMPEQTLNACALDRSDHEAFPSMPSEVPATTPSVLEKPVLGLAMSVADDEVDEESGFEGIGALRLPSEDEALPSIQEVVVVEVEKEGDENSGFEGIGELRLPSEDEELTRIQSDNY
jgi:hypothetical protein